MTFVKNTKGDLVYYTIPTLDKTNLVKHGFSTRLGGVSKEPFHSLNLGMKKNDTKENLLTNYKIFGQALNIPIENMVLSDQVHKDIILEVGEKDRGKGLLRDSDIVGVDALITQEKNTALVTFYADCVPLFFLDPINKAIGLAHSGWKSTMMKIGEKTLQKMMSLYGTNPQDCLIAIGPSIGSCCFEVGEDVIQPIQENFNGAESYYTTKTSGKYMVDLKQLIQDQFLQMGVSKDNITHSQICTQCNKDVFFSHRGDKGNTGSLAAVLQLV